MLQMERRPTPGTRNIKELLLTAVSTGRQVGKLSRLNARVNQQRQNKYNGTFLSGTDKLMGKMYGKHALLYIFFGQIPIYFHIVEN